MSSRAVDFRVPAAPFAAATVPRVIAARVAQLWFAMKNRREVSALGGLDTRMLKDIGLTPSDVSAALDCPLTQDPSCYLTKVAAGRPKYRVS